mgnify:FL=1
MSIQVTTQTTHDDVSIHLYNEEIAIQAAHLDNLNTIALNLGDLHIFLSPEQAQTLHEAIGESLLSSRLESLVK